MWPKYAVSALDFKLMTELTRRVFLGGAAAFIVPCPLNTAPVTAPSIGPVK